MGLPVSNDVAVQAAGWLAIPSTQLPVSMNLHPKSEDITWAYWANSTGCTKTGQTKKAVVGGIPITLSEISLANPYAWLSVNMTAAAWAPFVAGGHYLYSCYIYSDQDCWWSVRDCNGKFGQGAVQIKAGVITRVWAVIYGASTTKFDLGEVPTAALGTLGSSVSTPCAMVQNTNANIPSIWVGGTMIESVPGDYVDGVALIGDSTMAGSAGWVSGGTTGDVFRDFTVQDNREVSTVLGSELRLSIYNRAIGGNKLSDMDTRWATDISPIKHRCKGVIIQGGINDIGNGVTDLACRASVQSMTAKAVADGFQKIYYFDCTPNASVQANPVYEARRKAFNQWLSDTYGPAVCDISSVVTDPAYGDRLHSGAYNDGTHYKGAAKTAVAAYAVKKLDWSWRKTPSQYIKTNL